MAAVLATDDARCRSGGVREYGTVHLDPFLSKGSAQSGDGGRIGGPLAVGFALWQKTSPIAPARGHGESLALGVALARERRECMEWCAEMSTVLAHSPTHEESPGVARGLKGLLPDVPYESN